LSLVVAGPLIETRANGSLGKDVPAWLPTEETDPVLIAKRGRR
jgi:hypothetical protein